MEESIAENPKHQRAAKLVCSVNTNTVKNAGFTWNDVQQLLVWFLLDFLLPENLDSMLLKLCELILPSVYFSGLRVGLILRTSLQRKKFLHSNMLF